MSLKDFLSTKKIVFIAVPILILLIAGGILGYLKFFPNKSDATEEASAVVETEENEEEVDLTPKPIVPLMPFVVNLQGEAGTRYLKIHIQLELDDSDTEKQIVLKNPIIRDSILLLLSSKAFKDINTIVGKINLRNEITQRINAAINKGKVLQTYFSEFVIQ